MIPLLLLLAAAPPPANCVVPPGPVFSTVRAGEGLRELTTSCFGTPLEMPSGGADVVFDGKVTEHYGAYNVSLAAWGAQSGEIIFEESAEHVDAQVVSRLFVRARVAVDEWRRGDAPLTKKPQRKKDYDVSGWAARRVMKTLSPCKTELGGVVNQLEFGGPAKEELKAWAAGCDGWVGASRMGIKGRVTMTDAGKFAVQLEIEDGSTPVGEVWKQNLDPVGFASAFEDAAFEIASWRMKPHEKEKIVPRATTKKADFVLVVDSLDALPPADRMMLDIVLKRLKEVHGLQLDERADAPAEMQKPSDKTRALLKVWVDLGEHNRADLSDQSVLGRQMNSYTFPMAIRVNDGRVRVADERFAIQVMGITAEGALKNLSSSKLKALDANTDHLAKLIIQHFKLE